MKPTIEELVDAFHGLIEPHFPGTVVLHLLNTGWTMDSDNEVRLDVFGIPDAQMESFTYFTLDLWEEAEKAGLPSCILIPHSETATRKHYPIVLPVLESVRRKAESVEEKSENLGITQGRLYFSGALPDLLPNAWLFPIAFSAVDECAGTYLSWDPLPAKKNLNRVKPDSRNAEEPEYEEAA